MELHPKTLGTSRGPWLVWLLFLAAIPVIILVFEKQHSVTGAYFPTSWAWFEGRSLYQHALNDTPGNGFLYLPQSAILFSPFALMPHAVAEIAWRWLSIAAFAIAVWRFSQLTGIRDRRMAFALATVIALPLSLDAGRSGQATILMTALMMLAMGDTASGRYGRAAAWLTLGIALKPLAIVLVLLVAALYRPMRWRLAVGFAAMFALPLLLQRPDYVWSQYVDCVDMLRVAARRGDFHPSSQLFGMLHVWGVSVPRGAQLMLRVSAALGTLGAALWARRRLNGEHAAAMIFSLAVCYLMLFNPRTENNTYAAVGPAIGWFFALAVVERRRGLAVLLVMAAVAIVGTYEIGKHLADVRPIWLAPLGCAVFFTYLFGRLLVPEVRGHAVRRISRAGLLTTDGGRTA